MSNNGAHIISDISTEATDNSDHREKPGRGERAAIYLKGFDPTSETPPSSPLLSPVLKEMSPLSKPKFSVTDSSYSRTDALHLSRSYDRPVSCLKVSSDGRDSDEESEAGSRGARCGRVVSIRTSMWALSCVSMVVCAVTASLMLRRSYRTGLDDVHTAYSDEVRVLIAAGLRTQEGKTAQELLDVVRQVSASVTTGLIEAMSRGTFLTDMHAAYRLVNLRRAKQHFITSNNMTSAETLRLHFVGYESPDVSAVLLVEDELTGGTNNLHRLDVAKYYANGSMIVGQTNDTHFFFNSISTRSLDQDFPDVASFLTNGLLQTGDHTFTQPTVRQGKIIYPFLHASADGVIWFLGTTLTIDLVLMTTAHSGDMHCYVTLRDDWVARLGGSTTDMSGRMLTASHGTVVSTGGAEPVLLKPSESSDEQIRLTGKHYETHTPQEDVAITWYGQTLLYSVGKPLLADHGIDLMVFASLNATLIHIEATDIFGSLQNSIVRRLDRIDDAILVSERDTSLVVSAIALALMACSILLSMLILRPLSKLQEMLNRVANMELDDLEIKEESYLFEPRRMQRDFIAMVCALREYRAYVPKAILNDRSWAAQRPKVPPPEGVIAILFTDIKGSTMLWRKDAEAMTECMDIHNATIRAVLEEHGGYEVKTVGDSFMVAFQDPVASVKCALKIQLKLAKQEWPEALNLPRGGLVVRAGLHCGQTMKEENPNTGRTDFFGTTVNMASRLESTALGGTTCISSDMHALVLPLVGKLGTPFLHNYGPRDLKGLGQHLVYLICPAQMANRVSEDTSDCTMRCSDARSRSSMSSKLSCPRSRAGSLTLEHKKSGKGGSGSMKGNKFKVQSKISRAVMRSDLTVAVCQLVCVGRRKIQVHHSPKRHTVYRREPK